MTYIVDGMRLKKLRTDCRVDVVPAFPGGHDYPNLGMCGGLLAGILILLQTPFIHLVIKQKRDKRQLIKVGAVTQSFYG